MFETDPPALFMLMVAMVAGFAVYYAAFRFVLEEGLRRRRRPGQVRLAAAAAGVLFAGAIGFFITWGLVVVVIAAVISLVLLGLAGGGQRLTYLLIGLAIVLGVVALFTHRHHRPSPTNKPDSAPSTSNLIQPASPSAAGNLLHPQLTPIGPKDETPLIKPVTAPAKP